MQPFSDGPIQLALTRIVAILFICFVASISHGQNLVPNPGFENFSACPGAQSQLGNATGWDDPAGSITSSDYFNSCNGTVGTNCGNVSVPDNFCGNVPANNGDGYAGIITYYTSCPNCREYAEITLSTPLTAGTTYDIGFYVRPAEWNRYMIDLIGMNIQTGGHNQPGNQPIILTPTLESGMVDDVTVWTLVSGTYTAVGGEDHVAIGVFHDNVDLNVLDVGGSISGCALVNAGGHYLIDDVFVIETVGVVNVSADTPICEGETSTLTATPGSCVETTWYELGNPVAIGVCETLDVTPAVTTSYAAVDISGAADTVTVVVNPLPVVNIGPDQTVCPGETITLDAVIAGTYLWSNAATTQTITVGAEDEYWVEVTVNGCTGSDTMDLTVINPGAIDLGPDTTLCNGATLTLDAGPGGTGYAWSTGETTQTITVSTADDYSVDVTFNGCLASDMITVTTGAIDVNLGPDLTLCAGQSATLDATVAGATGYLWQDNSTLATLTTSAAGLYWAEVTDGNCTDRDSVQITVAPASLDLGNDTVLCQGETLTLDAGPGSPFYVWSNGQFTQTIDVNATGNYLVSIQIGGCDLSDDINVTVDNLSVNLPNDQLLCEGETFLLDASNILATSYAWSDGSTGNQLTVSTEDVYSVTVSNANCSVTDDIEIFVIPRLVDIDVVDTLLCEGQSFMLDISHPNAQSYVWNTGSTDPVVTIDSAGTYEVEVQNTLCSFTDQFTVRISRPIAGFSISDTAFCVPGTVSFNEQSINLETSDPIVSWDWDIGGNESISFQNPSYSYTQSGDFNVELSVTTAAGCTDDTTHPSTIHAWPVAEAGFSFTPFNPDPLNPVVDFIDESRGAAEIEWSFGDGATSTEFNPSHFYAESGVYEIIQWVTTENGCGDQVAGELEIRDPFLIYIPTAFSPNDDGINEVFYAQGEGIRTFRMIIYNRWGEPLFDTANMENGWDGTYKGKQVEAGVYTYHVEVNSIYLDYKEIFGKVVVLR